jgi:hypothetical protein
MICRYYDQTIRENYFTSHPSKLSICHLPLPSVSPLHQNNDVEKWVLCEDPRDSILLYPSNPSTPQQEEQHSLLDEEETISEPSLTEEEEANLPRYSPVLLTNVSVNVPKHNSERKC